MHTQIKSYTLEDEIATDFIIDIIETTMKRFSITYDKVVTILKDLRYWNMFNESYIVTIGAHEGVEQVLVKIEEYLNN